MPVLRIARRYAKSWFEFAKDSGELDEAYQDARRLRAICRLDDVSDFLKNPLIDTDKKGQILISLLQGKATNTTIRTLGVVVKHGRAQYIADICREFRTFYYEERHISRARLTTAVAVSDSCAQSIVRQFQQSGMLEGSVELERQVDASILGGFVLEFNNTVYNASVSYQLASLESQFSENLYTKKF